MHQERFEWLAATIREHGGEASVLEIQTIDDISPTMQQEAFRRARNVDYAALIDEVEKFGSVALTRPDQAQAGWAVG